MCAVVNPGKPSIRHVLALSVSGYFLFESWAMPMFCVADKWVYIYLLNKVDEKGMRPFLSTTQMYITILVFNIQLAGLFNQDEPSLFRLLRKDRKRM